MKIHKFFESLDNIEEYLKSVKSFNQICTDANITFNKQNKSIILEYLSKYNVTLNIRPRILDHPEKNCLCCNKPLDPKSKNKFCSHSCSATYNNMLRNPRYCLLCNKKLSPHQKKYCCKEHEKTYKFNNQINRWLNGNVINNMSQTPRLIRRYLFELHNSKCEKCGWGEINKSTGLVPLQIHHIDGDCTNNNINNLQLLCPNCHALTETFGSLNKNSTRYYQVRKYRSIKLSQ